ncbi:hypothetical protein FNV43_RR18537 [Rhamnella rubrinervis]|uniref:non-specific serine/threonine protein kinase n=1 Tax=Rhamnella rubrinervis TaxID=2594499 RepID=A0A8K0E597_9ROSA|nr:hypothetical protein FNV43_RR18537 [Rhamnella rubrinervis]
MSCSSSSGSEEDDEGVDSYRKGGYHAVRVGDQFNGGRYVAQRKLGWGQFSTVWLAYDTTSSKYVALKIQKVQPSLLKLLFMRLKSFQLLQMVIPQIPSVLELGIIHTDLKPENILLFSTIDPTKDPFRSGLTPILERPEGNPNGGVTMNIIEKKLKRRARRAVAKISERRASMGGALEPLKSEKNWTGLIAPEVILQSGYSYSVDMWSFGCIAFELATGDMMFAPKGGQGFSEDEDHLALMVELLGKIPRKVAIGGARSKDLFDRYGDLKRIQNDAREFAEFLCPLLDFAPEKRPTAQQCLQHPWLNLSDSTQREMKNEPNVEKVNVGMSNLQLKVGK